MKIGILDFYHYAHIHTMSKIFNYNGNEIFIFVDNKVNKQLKINMGEEYDRFSWVIKNENESISEYFKRIKKVINKENIDILFINTLQDNYFQFIKLFSNLNTKKVLTIHNTNTWFQKRLPISIKDLGFLIIRKIILKQIDLAHVFGENIKEYTVDKLKYKKIFCSIPFSLFEEEINYNIKESDLISFTVIGNIEYKRRDYDLILQVFKDLFKKYNNISLNLLGSPVGDYGKNILSLCKEMNQNGANIKFYDGFVNSDEFDNVLKTSSVVICPLNIEIYNGEILELYGVSKSSGSIYDIIKFAKPGIYPSNFKCPKELTTNIVKYKDSDDLKKILSMIIEDKEYLKILNKNAINNSKSFTLPSVRNKIKEDINNLLDIKSN